MPSLFATALLCACTVTAAAGLAAVFGRASFTLDVAAHFAPVTALAGLILAPLALAFGTPASAILAAVAAVAATAGMAPELVSRARRRLATPIDGRTIRVVQFNLWRLNRDVEATLAWLAGEEADVVVVQEVIDRSAEIPERLKGAYPHQVEGVRVGTRILSRWPLADGGGYRARSTKTHSTGVWAQVEHPAGVFPVFGFQATWPIPPGLQQRDSADLAARLAPFDRESLIVCGDFNSTPWSGALARQDRLFGLERRSRALFTWPVQPYTQLKLTSPLPFLAIDHIYAGPAWRTVSVKTGPRLGSDHLPVVAVLVRAPSQ